MEQAMSDFTDVVGLEDGEVVEGLYHLAKSDFEHSEQVMANLIKMGLREPLPEIRDVSTIGIAIVTNFDVYVRVQFVEGCEDMGITYQDDWYVSTNRCAYESGLTVEAIKEQAHYLRAAYTENGTRIE